MAQNLPESTAGKNVILAITVLVVAVFVVGHVCRGADDRSSH